MKFFAISLLLMALLTGSFFFNADVGRQINNTIAFTGQQTTIDTISIGTKTITSNLNVPWEITWGPDNWIWFTEQSGTVSKVNPATGEKKLLLRIPEVYRVRSLGLLGMAIHPDKKLPYVFLDLTYRDGKSILSKLVRYTYTADTLKDPFILLKDIAGATSHNGSRVAISPDGKVMMSTGYATKLVNSQNDSSLNGKILRLNIDGTIPADNPIPGSPIWSRGHRNPQGLVFGRNGMLYSSEHGDAIEDELNLIRKNANYGWPSVEGFISTPEEKKFNETTRVTEPLKAWTPVIAPAGIDYYNFTAIPEWKNAILLVTLKSQSFRVLKLNDKGDAVVSEHIYLDHQVGRLRDVCVSPAGDVYVSTSNRDWNPAEGYPKPDDDKIIKLVKISHPAKSALVKANARPALSPGAVVYNNYCASCHKNNGAGVPGVFPSLTHSARITGSKTTLITILLKGLKPSTINGIKYDQEMPAFSFLSNRDVALVSTYIRTQFGNKASAVQAAEVLKIRKLNKL